MSVGPPLSGSVFAFSLAVLKDVCIYIKHKRRQVIDLLQDFVKLKDEVNDLLACWKDINDKIARQPESIQKNERYTTMEKKVSRKEEEFKKIDGLYRKLCTDLESIVGAASGSNAGTDGHRSQNAEEENQTPRNAAANNQRSQEAENGSQTNTSGAANENQADIGEQKIWTRNFFKLARLDKDVVKLKDEVSKLQNELVRGVEAFTRPTRPQKVEIMQAEELGDIVPSHQRHLEDLLKYVKQETCKRIGIYGPPGVGITNILKNLNNCFHASSPLNGNLNVDYVIWVTVSEENNQEKLIQTIQEEIIERLKITGGNTRSRNGDIISSFLFSKKYLLILDDFSSLVKLEDVGIQKEHKHGKVVMAAKSSHALRNVEPDVKIQITELTNLDAHRLFKHFIKNYDDLLQEQKHMVYPIVTQLGGLPEFIKLTAQYLNEHRQLPDWKGIKQGSQSDVRIPELLGMAPAIESYKKVYEDLKENYLQKCLLYAALFPSRYKISRNTLVECWKAENFLDRRLSTLNAARAEGTLVFSRLTSSCLLQSCDERHVKMSVFFRKVAFVISFPGEGDGALCVRSVSDKDGHLEEREWNNARRVSLIRNDLDSESLPIRPQCEGISTLLLQHNLRLKLINDGFFINMKGLRVMNLYDTGIASLPPSISNLIELRSLYLNDCVDLNKLPTTINMLQKLEVLDIRGTSIPCLPAEILNLVSLRCLRISFAVEKSNLATGLSGWKLFSWPIVSPTKSWVIFPPDAHTKLSNLEEMTIDLKGEISDQIRNKMREEAANFNIRKDFQFKLVPHPGQSFGPYPQASKGETGEPSNVVEEPAKSPSNVDERPAGSDPSTAMVLQSKNNQTSDGQNTTFQSHSHGQNASPYCSCFGRTGVTSSREDKGKGVEKPPGQIKKTTKPVQIHPGRGIEIKESSMTNNTAALSDSDDETDASVPNQPQMRNANRRIDTSAGEGTSAAH